MKTDLRFLLAGVGFAAACVLCGCGRDSRVNSDPGPGGPSAADSGKPVVNASETSRGAASGAATTAPATGTDSTGRPSDSSGGVTGGGSGSGTSGTQTDSGGTKAQTRP